MPKVGAQDQFEQDYTAKLKLLLADHGQFVAYEKDRAALDLGLQLYERDHEPALPTPLSQVRIWFQLKGIQETTLSGEEMGEAEQIAVRGISVDHLRYWFAHPEPVYLVAYVEAIGTFLAEDVRELVERAGGAPWLEGLGDQDTTTLHLDPAATLERALEAMPRHRSLRVDGPDFRGRPLGHNRDPLRSELEVMPAGDFHALVDRLLAAHQFKAEHAVDLSALLDRDIGEVTAVVGQPVSDLRVHDSPGYGVRLWTRH